MFQQVMIAGYLGRDPEMRYTPDGVPVTNFSVATSRKWKNKDGDPGEETVWWRITAWRRLGEVCNEFLRKGRPVLIVGRVNPDDNGNPRVFERKDGTYGASFELTAVEVKFLGGRGDTGPAPDQSDEPAALEDQDEIPF